MFDSPDLPARWVRVALASAALCVVASALPGFLAGGAPVGNDNSSHFAEILAVADHLRAGETDFWFDQTNLGYPLFLAYQPLPSLGMGALVALLGDAVPPLLLFKLSIVLVWALMPLAWYVGGRWLGMDRLAALVLGLLLLVVNDFRAFGLGLSSGLANGLYTQAWGALLLPLAIGSAHRFLFGATAGPARPAALLAGTYLCHAFLGLFASLAAAAMVPVRREGAWRRARRLGALLALALPLLAFWLVPFLANLEHQGGLPWKFESENGYPPGDLFRWTVSGDLFDHGRIPWLTFLALAGALVSARRREPLDRWLLVLLAATVALLLGPTTWGPRYRSLPLHGELEVVRYLIGVHFCGLVLAALAARRLVPHLRGFLERASGPAWLSPERTLAAIGVVVLAGFLLGTWGNGRLYLRTSDVGEPGYAGVADRLRSGGGSRFLVHEKLRTADHFYLNLLPAVTRRPQLQSFARGYHDTLSVYYLEYFDWSASAFSLYNVGAVVARDVPRGLLPDGFRETWAHGELRLLERAPPGYFDFVRTPLTVVGDPKAVRRLLRWATVPLYGRGVLPRLATSDPGSGDRIVVGDDGRVASVALASLGSGDPSGPNVARALAAYEARPPRSRVLGETHGRNEYRAVVDAAGGEERLLLKASYHPYWHASAGGEALEVAPVAPSLMAVALPAGRHEVVFRYRNPAYQKLLFAASVATVGAGSLAALRGGRRRREASRAPVTERSGR